MKNIDQRIEKAYACLDGDRTWMEVSSNFFSVTPRVEIFYDLKLLKAKAEFIKTRIENSGTPEEVEKIALIIAYLRMAETEGNFTKAWSYINAAEVLLVHVVPEDQLRGCIQRLQTSDQRLPTNLRRLLTEPLGND